MTAEEGRGQTAAFDVRALRDEQVADATGQPLPVEARRGQVEWTVDGGENLVLIGRAEQADVAGAMSSSYGCINCCPASFFDAWIEPISVSGFVGDQTQFTFYEQKENCYGTLLAPVQRSASFGSLDEFVASCTAEGLATGENPGSTQIGGWWTTFLWEIDRGGGCMRTPLDVLRHALCEVFDQQLKFTDVSYKGAFAGFEVGLGRQTAALNLNQASDGERVCATSGDDRQFSITINFTFPPGGSLHNRDSHTHQVITGANNQFEWTDWGFLSESSSFGRGSMFIKLFRKSVNNSNKHVDFIISGNQPPGAVGTFRGRGRVVLNCFP